MAFVLLKPSKALYAFVENDYVTCFTDQALQCSEQRKQNSSLLTYNTDSEIRLAIYSPLFVDRGSMANAIVLTYGVHAADHTSNQ